MESSLQNLRLEPPTNDVEICCRFEDIASEGHACYAKKEYTDARECYLVLVQLAAQLKRQSPLMKSTSHFFLSMACNCLGEELLAKGKAEASKKMLLEATSNSELATKILDYGEDSCPLEGLDKQLLEDYDTFRTPSVESMLLRNRYHREQDEGGDGPADTGGAAVNTADASNQPIGSSGNGVPAQTSSSSKKKKKKKKKNANQAAAVTDAEAGGGGGGSGSGSGGGTGSNGSGSADGGGAGGKSSGGVSNASGKRVDDGGGGMKGSGLGDVDGSNGNSESHGGGDGNDHGSADGQASSHHQSGSPKKERSTGGLKGGKGKFEAEAAS